MYDKYSLRGYDKYSLEDMINVIKRLHEITNLYNYVT